MTTQTLRSRIEKLKEEQKKAKKVECECPDDGFGVVWCHSCCFIDRKNAKLQTLQEELSLLAKLFSGSPDGSPKSLIKIKKLMSSVLNGKKYSVMPRADAEVRLFGDLHLLFEGYFNNDFIKKYSGYSPEELKEMVKE